MSKQSPLLPFIDVLHSCDLFRNISSEQLASLLDCLGAELKTYKKDAFVLRVGDAAKRVGIVAEGAVHVIQEDFWGNRTILTDVEPGGLFAEAFSSAGAQSIPVSVTTTKPSQIIHIDYQKIISTCPSTCSFHMQLINNMLQILARKNIALTRKMEYLSQRSTKEKLLAYLSDQAKTAKSTSFTIPFDRQQLADFLCVDRSALSRELSTLKKQGVIDYKRNVFTLSLKK